jgi:hypothetical protein
MTTPQRSCALYEPTPANDSLASAPGFAMRRISTREDWETVRALRFDALRARGEIPGDGEHSHGDGHDAALNAATFVLARNDRPVGSTRSSVSSASRRWPLPSMEVFAREIDSALGPDATVVEASLTVVDPASAVDPKVALFHLFKAHMLHCAAENADWLVAAVRDSQMGFYRRMFNMEILTGAEMLPGMASPRVLMGLEYRGQAPLLFKRLPVLAVTDADVREFAATGEIAFHGPRRGAPVPRRDAGGHSLARD